MTASILAATLALVALPVQAQEEPPDVDVEVLADVAAVRPGATFHLAVLLTLPEHWHVYCHGIWNVFFLDGVFDVYGVSLRAEPGWPE